MDRRPALFISVVALIFFGAGCDKYEIPKLADVWPGGQSKQSEESEVSIEYANLTVAIGRSFTIEFEGNETTEYRWSAEYSRPNLEFVKDEYVPHEWAAPSNMETNGVSNQTVGAGGTHYFTFSAVQPGVSQIRFEYMRPWEDVPPLKVVIYNIKVK